jgi:hypothetical protein
MANQKTILFACLAGIAAFTVIVLIFDIDLIRWFSCSSPFANPQDQTSALCQRLEKVP